jgi:hypothetical protein
MHARLPAALLAACVVFAAGAAGAAFADTTVVNDQVQVRESNIDRPHRGATMADVEKHFGEPVNRHPTVGQPPITRWDYKDFAVVFEHDRVVDAVVTGG